MSNHEREVADLHEQLSSHQAQQQALATSLESLTATRDDLFTRLSMAQQSLMEVNLALIISFCSSHLIIVFVSLIFIIFLKCWNSIYYYCSNLFLFGRLFNFYGLFYVLIAIRDFILPHLTLFQPRSIGEWRASRSKTPPCRKALSASFRLKPLYKHTRSSS